MDDKNKEYEEIEKEEDESVDISDESDAELLKDPQREFEKGVEGDEYDILPELEKADPEADRFSGKEGVCVRYSFNGAEVRQALKIFQRDTIYKKNAVYSLLLLVIFMIYTVNLIKHPDEAFSMFLAALCLAVIMFIWYLPAKHIKKAAQAADSEPIALRMTIYGDCVWCGEDESGFVLNYNKEITKVFETPDLFLLCVGKERVFILPKRCLDGDGEQEAKIREFLQDGMKDRYVEVKGRE